VINPDPGCTYDCQAKAGYAFLLAAITLAWWVGLAAGNWIGSRLDRSSN
jgi:hypothetical protein